MTDNVIRYETEGMAELRRMLLTKGHTDAAIDTFKSCLISLEKLGFTLIKEPLPCPT